MSKQYFSDMSAQAVSELQEEELLKIFIIVSIIYVKRQYSGVETQPTLVSDKDKGSVQDSLIFFFFPSILIFRTCVAIFFRSRDRPRRGEPAGRRFRQRQTAARHGPPAYRRDGAQRCPTVWHLPPAARLARMRLQDSQQVKKKNNNNKQKTKKKEEKKTNHCFLVWHFSTSCVSPPFSWTLWYKGKNVSNSLSLIKKSWFSPNFASYYWTVFEYHILEICWRRTAAPQSL